MSVHSMTSPHQPQDLPVRNAGATSRRATPLARSSGQARAVCDAARRWWCRRPLRRPPGQARIDVGCGSKLVQLKCDVDDPILALRTSLESALLEHFQHRGVFWKHLCDQFFESGVAGKRREMAHQCSADTLSLVLVNNSERHLGCPRTHDDVRRQQLRGGRCPSPPPPGRGGWQNQYSKRSRFPSRKNSALSRRSGGKATER
jgi:hypothetical protein